MKKITTITILIFLLGPFSYGQGITDTIRVSFTKSVYLIFDSKPSYDAGSEDIIVRESDNKLAENKLIVQAAVENFEETNLFVQVGGEMFMFIIVYDNKPVKYLYNYQKGYVPTSAANTTSINNSQTPITSSIGNKNVDLGFINKAEIEKRQKDSLELAFSTKCEKVYTSNKHPFNQGAIAYGCLVFCPSMYADQNHFYIKIMVENTTNINYDVDYLSFVIRNKKALLKKNTTQDYPMKPAYLYKSFSRIEGKTKISMVAVFDKFTIDKMKLFTAEIWEKNGDRRINLDIDGNIFLNILPFSSL